MNILKRAWNWLTGLFKSKPVVRDTNKGEPTDGSPRYDHVPGTKVARKMLKTQGIPYTGQYYHTGELTEANNKRAAERRWRKAGWSHEATS